MARISDNQIADLLEEKSFSEREVDLDEDVDNLITSSDSESDQREIVPVENSKTFINNY